MELVDDLMEHSKTGLCSRCAGEMNAEESGHDDNSVQTTEMFEQELNSKEDVKELRKIVRWTRDEKWQAVRKATCYRMRLGKFMNSLQKFADEVNMLQFTVQKIRECANNQIRLIREEFRSFVGNVTYMLLEYGQTQNTKEEIDATSEELTPMQKENSELANQLEALRLLYEEASYNLENTKKELNKKNSKVAQLEIHVKSREAIEDQKTCSYQQIQKTQEIELKAAKKEINSLRKRLKDLQISQDEIRKEASQSLYEVALMKSLMTKVYADLDAVRLERDEVKNELAEKCESIATLNVEIKYLEIGRDKAIGDSRSIKHENRELEIEKQRIQKSLEQRIVGYQANETRLKKHFYKTSLRSEKENEKLKKTLSETLKTSSQTEADLRNQIDRLKYPIDRRKDTGTQTVDVCTEFSTQYLYQAEPLKHTVEECKLKIATLEYKIRKEGEEKRKLLKALADTEKKLDKKYSALPPPRLLPTRKTKGSFLLYNKSRGRSAANFATEDCLDLTKIKTELLNSAPAQLRSPSEDNIDKSPCSGVFKEPVTPISNAVDNFEKQIEESENYLHRRKYLNKSFVYLQNYKTF